MNVLLIGAVALLALVAVAAVVSSRRRRRRSISIGLTGAPSGPVVVVLDVRDADPADPAVIRLVHETGVRALAEFPDVVEVEVRARGGRLLGTADRRIRRPKRVAIPRHLYEPHESGTGAPAAAPPAREEDLPATATPRLVAALEPPPRPLADRFELPGAVRERVRDPRDPVDLVRAILEASGADVSVAGDLLRVGEVAVVVIPAHGSELVGADALNHAYRRVLEARADRGVVLSMGPLRVEDVHRREMLAPHVLHAGPDGIQRMADAVAVGADPLRFAVAPAVAT